MREILFRGKRADNGEWVEGSLIHQTKFYGDPIDRYHILYDGEFHADYYGSAEVIPETVGQFTGLTDKNGKKIFEGDILSAQVCKYDKPEFYAVEWWNESCGFEPLSDSKENCGHCGGGWDTIWVEVVGNIHDNPELLEVKK